MRLSSVLITLFVLDAVAWVLPWIILSYIVNGTIGSGVLETVADTYLLNEFKFALIHLWSAFVITDAWEHHTVTISSVVKQTLVLMAEIFLLVGAFTRIPAFEGPGFALSHPWTLDALKYISVASVVLSGLTLLTLLVFYVWHTTSARTAKRLLGDPKKRDQEEKEMYDENF